MKKQEFKQLVKECIKEVIETSEPYDAKTDTFAYGPRDRMGDEENHPDYKLLQWARERLSRESNKLNRDTLEKLIKMLKSELYPNDSNSEQGSGPDSYPPILRKDGKISDVG